MFGYHVLHKEKNTIFVIIIIIFSTIVDKWQVDTYQLSSKLLASLVVQKCQKPFFQWLRQNTKLYLRPMTNELNLLAQKCQQSFFKWLRQNTKLQLITNELNFNNN